MNRTYRVMVVDDEASIRLGRRVALEAAVYQVIEAEDGEEAIDLLRTSPMDLALLDLRMPLLGGLETLRHLREIGDHTPVAIIPAHGDVPATVAALNLGGHRLPPEGYDTRGTEDRGLRKSSSGRLRRLASPPCLGGSCSRTSSCWEWRRRRPARRWRRSGGVAPSWRPPLKVRFTTTRMKAS